jgi:hypothetical protein
MEDEFFHAVAQTDLRMDRRTGTTKLIADFCDFAKALKIVQDFIKGNASSAPQ